MRNGTVIIVSAICPPKEICSHLTFILQNFKLDSLAKDNFDSILFIAELLMFVLLSSSLRGSNLIRRRVLDFSRGFHSNWT